MSDTPTGDPGKPMEQSNNDLSEVMRQLSVTSDKTSPSLSDMPIDVVALITEKLDYKQQLKLRKVSKSLRALIDERKPACTYIGVGFFYSVGINFDNQHVMYMNHDYDFEVDDGDVKVMRDDFKKVAFEDLASTLKNPKLQLEKFSVVNNKHEDIGINQYNEIRNVLESLNHQVSVKEIDIRIFSPSCLLSILPFLKTGVLKIILLSFDDNWRNDSSGMDQIALLDQWKQAEELYLVYPSHRFPMEYATHFKRFLLFETTMNDDEFTRIKNFLSKLDHLEQFTLFIEEFLFILDSSYQVLGEPVSRTTTKEIFHYTIPDSDCFLELRRATRSAKLEFEKKKRGGNC